MAVNITGVANSGVAPRSLQATSTGRLWVAAGDATANTIEFWYSDDAGVTWTENTAAQITWDGANYFAFYIDADDHAHIAYDETATVALKYRRNKSISTPPRGRLRRQWTAPRRPPTSGLIWSRTVRAPAGKRTSCTSATPPAPT